MPINIGKLELEIAKKIGDSATSDPADLQILANSVKQLKNNPIDYISTYASLPAASTTNKGEMYYVDSECSVYWSTGCCNYPLQNSTGINQLYVFGQNTLGVLGTGNTTTYSSPVTTAGGGMNWRQVSTTICNSTAAIKTDGTLWTWGAGSLGNLGNNNTASGSSPITTAGGGTNWRCVDGRWTAVAALKTDGTLWTWGGSFSSSPTSAPYGNTWCTLSYSINFSAVKTDGTLWMWGTNNCGQLGTGNITSYASPVTTAGGGTNWCNGSAGMCHSGGLKTDGTLWMWGLGGYGRLGNNATTNASSPITTAGGGTNWCQLSLSWYSSSAIKTDGTLWTWGNNSQGQLGTGNATGRSSPGTPIGGGTNWCQSYISEYFSGGIKTDGTLWMWGYNNCGQLGTNDIINYSSPVTTAGGNNWCFVSLGRCSTNAIQSKVY